MLVQLPTIATVTFYKCTEARPLECTPYLAAGGDARRARGTARTTFDPGDADHFAAAASPVLRGLPAGQRD